jgi:putative endonuclease
MQILRKLFVQLTLTNNCQIMTSTTKDHIELGRSGENMAVTYLEEKGYKILERNWRWGREEIDIIARDGSFIVIVEVKTRSTNVFAEPEASVTKSKQKILVRAANAYVNYRRHPGEVRFDIISVIISQESNELNHIPDAFYATL